MARPIREILNSDVNYFEKKVNKYKNQQITIKKELKELRKNSAQNVDAICNNSEPATFENTIVALDRSGLLLGEIIGAFNAMSNAQSNDEILAIEEEMELLCTAHHNDISLNEKVSKAGDAMTGALNLDVPLALPSGGTGVTSLDSLLTLLMGNVRFETFRLDSGLSKTFTFTFGYTAKTAYDWQLCFNFGEGAGTYTVKNVTLHEVNID